MEELRKIQHLDKLVVVEDRTMSSSAILSLNKPGSDKKMANPFFPSKVVPVDCLSNSKGYVLLVLLERVSSEDVQKFGIDSKSVAAESELRTKGSASRKPYERDFRLRLQQEDRRWMPNTVWDRGAFSQQRYDARGGAMQNSLSLNAASYEHFQTGGVQRACVGAVNSLTSVASEYELRRWMEEDYRRQMIEEEEEEHRQWLAKEEERRLMEEMHLRQVQEEDWIRWVHHEQIERIQEEERRRIEEEEEEWRRRIGEEERMRQIQEEWMRELQEEEEERMRQIQEECMREIQEERMREIQEEERMRRIQEERMRRIQAEEERMRQVQEEHMRKIQEEERMRRIQEERMREIQAEEERMRRVQEEHMRKIQEEQMRRMREIQEEERMRRVQEERRRHIQEEEERMRKIQEERMRQIQEERMKQIHEVEHMRRIQEEEYRKIEEEEWKRQVHEAEWRRQMQEEQRRIKEEEWRRQIQEDERRKQIQKEEQRRIKEEDWRRKMQRESQKRPVIEEKCSEKVVEEEQLRRPVKEERERELVRGSVVRSRNDLVQDLVAGSLRAAAIPQLSADAAQKVKKHLVAETIRTVGTMEQGERPGGGRNREVGGISREDKTVSRFGTSDKEISQSRHLEEEYLRYIREVESAHNRSHDTSGGAVGRYGSEQNDLKVAQHRAVGIKSSDKLPSLLDLKLKHPEVKVDRSYSALHSEDRVGDTNQWQRKVPTVRKEFDSQAERDRPTARSFNYGNQARDLLRNEKSTFSSVTENIADIYLRRSDLDQENQRSSARRGRTDVHGASNRNVIGRPEHSWKDRRHTVSGRPSTRPWLDSN